MQTGLLRRAVHSLPLPLQEMQDPDCPCRRRLRELQCSGWDRQIERMGELNDRLRQLVHAKYAEVSATLLSELRIFAGCNAVVFALLGLVALRRRRATLQLLAPTAVLLGAAAMVACVYLFSQNWLQTIPLRDFVGWTYVPWLGLATAGMADVVWNRARICTRLVRAAANAVGASLSAVPC